MSGLVMRIPPPARMLDRLPRGVSPSWVWTATGSRAAAMIAACLRFPIVGQGLAWWPGRGQREGFARDAGSPPPAGTGRQRRGDPAKCRNALPGDDSDLPLAMWLWRRRSYHLSEFSPASCARLRLR